MKQSNRPFKGSEVRRLSEQLMDLITIDGIDG
jgi:hypothetical protein